MSRVIVVSCITPGRDKKMVENSLRYSKIDVLGWPGPTG